MSSVVEYLDLAVKWLGDGSVAEAARRLGVSHAAVWSWRRLGVVPPKRAVQIENLTGGAVRREQLNPIFRRGL